MSDGVKGSSTKKVFQLVQVFPFLMSVSTSLKVSGRHRCFSAGFWVKRMVYSSRPADRNALFTKFIPKLSALITRTGIDAPSMPRAQTSDTFYWLPSGDNSFLFSIL